MNKYLRTCLLSFGVVLGATAALLGFSSNVSAAVDNTPDCDNVAVIRCGVFSAQDLREKTRQGDVPRVFRALGITQNELKGTFVGGIVWRDGRVTVGDKVVATGAMTAGRNFGGTPISGTNGAGKYPTSKFATEGQTAFVKMIDGKFSFAVIKACGNPVSAKPKTAEQQPQPAYECVSLTAEKLSRTKYRFTVKASATGGATIKTYQYGFGDGYGVTWTETPYTYTYKKPGTYKANVVVHVRVGDTVKKVTRPACEKTITIPEVKKPVVEMCQYDDSLPKNSPNCVKPGQGAEEEMCEIEGKEHFPADSEECVEEEVVEQDEQEVQGTTDEAPAEISKTGPEAVTAGILGSGMLSFGAYSYASSRRQLISKLLGR